MLMRRLWKSGQIAGHIGLGFGLLVGTGALWRPHARHVRSTMSWWLGRIHRILEIDVESATLPHEREQAALFVSNHVSWLDIAIIGGQTPVSFLAKSEVAGWPLIGTLAEKVGTLFIRRGSGDTAQVVQSLHSTLQGGRSILFFPEGTTTRGNSLKKFHLKLFNICQHGDIHVYPLVVQYYTDANANGHSVPSSCENPVPFVDDDEFASHLWRLMGYRHLKARIIALAPVTVTSTHMSEQVRHIESRMRAVLESHAS